LFLGKSIYETIIDRMEEKKIKNADLARKLNKNKAAFHANLEYLKRNETNLKTIILIAEALNMDIMFNLIGREKLQKESGCFIDRSVTHAGGKTVVTFADGYQVFFSVQGLSNDDYLERARKIRGLKSEL
jgi:hypothetical protein